MCLCPISLPPPSNYTYGCEAEINHPGKSMSFKKVADDFGSQYKCPFHEATKRNKIVDQNIQICRLVMKTCRHQQMAMVPF